MINDITNLVKSIEENVMKIGTQYSLDLQSHLFQVFGFISIYLCINKSEKKKRIFDFNDPSNYLSDSYRLPNGFFFLIVQYIAALSATLSLITLACFWFFKLMKNQVINFFDNLENMHIKIFFFHSYVTSYQLFSIFVNS